MLTTGDKLQEAPESAVRDKKDWILELEQGLLEAEIELAVHSAKDVPVDIHPDTMLVPVLHREQPWDVLIPKGAQALPSLQALAQGSTLGTSSLRRSAQLRWLRPDLEIKPLRGNVPTRLKKLAESGLDSIVLARAGLQRLDLLPSNAYTLLELIPAVNQGILLVQLLRSRQDVLSRVRELVERDVENAFLAERRVVEILKADCHSAVSIFAENEAGELFLRGEVYAQDASKRIYAEQRGSADEPLRLGERLAEELLSQGAAELL